MNLLTIKESLKKFSISHNTLRAWVRQGLIGLVEKNGKKYYIESELDKVRHRKTRQIKHVILGGKKYRITVKNGKLVSKAGAFKRFNGEGYSEEFSSRSSCVTYLGRGL